MPDAMSPDQLVDVVAKVICGWPTLCDAHKTEAERLIRGLHAAGYRVVAAESETLDVDGGAAYARGPRRRAYFRAPTEEERQHDPE